MLVLTILSLYILTLFIVALISLMMMCVWYSHNTNAAELEALQIAQILNGDNSVGNLNDMTAASRELTFTTRTQWYQTQSSRYKYFSDLANDLHNSSRQSSVLLTQEREEQISATLEKVKTFVHDFNFKRRSLSPLDNVVLTSPVKIVEVDLGYIDGVQSRAYVPESCPQLEEFDYESKVADPNSKLLRPSEHLSVPYDENLHYVVSSLPAQVNGQQAPARLSAGQHFHSLGKLIDNNQVQNLRLQIMPTAAKVTLLRIVNGANKTVLSTAYAMSHGAETAPWQQR